MPKNPLFQSSNSPTRTTKPTKAVNETDTRVRLSHNTFDNSYFLFKTQRFGQYEPFWWKSTVAGDNEPYSNSHNVRSLPFASPILSPMKLNKDYFQVPLYAIQPNTWDYIFKTPSQGDDVPASAQNLFPLFRSTQDGSGLGSLLSNFLVALYDACNADTWTIEASYLFLYLLTFENFFSTGSLLYNLGYKLNPIFESDSEGTLLSFDEFFDMLFSDVDIYVEFRLDDPDMPTGYRDVDFTTSLDVFSGNYEVDKFTILSLLRSFFGSITAFQVSRPSFTDLYSVTNLPVLSGNVGLDSIRMDVINAYQLACAQYYVNPRVDFLYNAQLYRDNFVQLLRQFVDAEAGDPLSISSFDYNGIPVLYDYFSQEYYEKFTNAFYVNALSSISDLDYIVKSCSIIFYLFGYREQLKFGDYIVDSRTQALGYGEPGSDVVNVMDDSVSVVDMSQKLVLTRFRSAVAHLDNSAEDYLETMFHEKLPPDYHYPKFIVHSEFAINGEEVSNTTSDNQGNIVTNLKSGEDTAEFNIEISVPSILIGISYVSIPRLYSQIKERAYMHADRYDMFQPMLQYFGDQQIFNREVSDSIPNPEDSYGYVSRNGEYKQRLSQVSGAFVHSLRSWVFTTDLLPTSKESSMPLLAYTQSPIAIRAHDFEFNRFLARQTGLSLGTGFHFIMQYNNKNVDNRPMDVNPLPLYPNNSL